MASTGVGRPHFRSRSPGLPCIYDDLDIRILLLLLRILRTIAYMHYVRTSMFLHGTDRGIGTWTNFRRSVQKVRPQVLQRVEKWLLAPLGPNLRILDAISLVFLPHLPKSKFCQHRILASSLSGSVGPDTSLEGFLACAGAKLHTTVPRVVRIDLKVPISELDRVHCDIVQSNRRASEQDSTDFGS